MGVEVGLADRMMILRLLLLKAVWFWFWEERRVKGEGMVLLRDCWPLERWASNHPSGYGLTQTLSQDWSAPFAKRSLRGSHILPRTHLISLSLPLFFFSLYCFLEVIFKKLFFKFFCICLSLKKLVNEKHFPVKENFGLVSRKIFLFLVVFVFRKVVSRKPLSKLFYFHVFVCH